MKKQELTEGERKKRIKKMETIMVEEINEVLHKEIQWKNGIIVTIVQIVISVDLQYAHIHVSVLPDNEEEYVMKTLEKEEYRIQRHLYRRLQRKIVPKCIFMYHKGGEYQNRIDQLISEL